MLFKALQIDDKRSLAQFARKTKIPLKRLKYYNDARKMPSGNDLEIILKETGVSQVSLMLLTGHLSKDLKTMIAQNADQLNRLLSFSPKKAPSLKQIQPVFTTKLGQLFQCDCLDLFQTIENDSVDLIFADPPFNLNKLYPSGINDDLKADQYLSWCEKWLFECTRILKPGGSFFVWNLPKWNSQISEYLNTLLTFRHWISRWVWYDICCGRNKKQKMDRG